ncbi:MAG: hypothetical protein JW837_11485 [Sedimentisphaerales bacterium]|nr:hypothetical protein [Sedimentisphaerales bacterium]
MSYIRKLVFLTFLICVSTTQGQTKSTDPHIGYIYPGGGQRGTVVLITVGGQYLRGITDIYVSGKGVHGSVLEYIRPTQNIQKEQRDLLDERMEEVKALRIAEITGRSSSNYMKLKEESEKRIAQKLKALKEKEEADKKKDIDKKKEEPEKKEVEMPEHPLLYKLQDKSIRQLAHIRNILFYPRSMLQPNRQIAETLLIEVTIDSDAQPGQRELRLGTKTALTNPVVFQVDILPEVLELEPNNKEAYQELPEPFQVPNLPREKAHELPVLFNGQVMPGDIDRFRFRANKGQKLVIEAHARSLIPYLADAVPGWFQATLALYDAVGRELAFADDYRFNPDPVLFYEVPGTAEYELEIRDSIFRGREDFVYRISISERPFITQAFPLGAKEGTKALASVSGWNLPVTHLPLDTQHGDCIRQTAYENGKQFSNSISYAVDTLPECNETESNDSIKSAQQINLPRIINGRIDKPGDVDVFRLSGLAADIVAVEVYARRLNSPLDSLVRLTDYAGRILEWNDDYVLKKSHLHTNMRGLLTHHADSYLIAELPQNGNYYVHLVDSQNHGGDEYAYRLRITAPQSDFALRIVPSSISIKAGGIVPISIYASRKDGFDDEIEVVLKNPSTGFKLDGAKIPAGQDSVRMTLTAPAKGTGMPVALQLEGRIGIGGRIISRPVLAADDVMQAFLYRHLVPAEELMVLVRKDRWQLTPAELISYSPVRVTEGSSVEVRVKTRSSSTLKEIKLELVEPPKGLTLENVNAMPDGLVFNLKAEKDVVQSDFADNLIIEAVREYRTKKKDGTYSGKTQRYSMGVLPAIPVKVTTTKKP